MSNNKVTIEANGESFETDTDSIKSATDSIESASLRAKLSKPVAVVGGKELIESDIISEVAEKVIKNENFDLRPARIGYLFIYPNISKTTVAKTSVTSRELKYYSDYDYLIEISGEAWDMLDENAQYMLMYHELLHIQPEYNEKKEEWKFKIRPHDFGEFNEINKNHGTNYQDVIRTTVSSLYDLDPSQEGKITL